MDTCASSARGVGTFPLLTIGFLLGTAVRMLVLFAEDVMSVPPQRAQAALFLALAALSALLGLHGITRLRR